MDTRQLPELMTLDSVGRWTVPHWSTSGVSGLMSGFTRERMKEKSEGFVQVVASELGKFTFCTRAAVDVRLQDDMRGMRR